MEAVNYFLGLVIIFAGIITGMILAFIAKEELKPGKKYILLFQKVLLSLIFVISISYSGHIALSIVLSAVLVYLFIFKFPFNDKLTYCVFGFIYFMFANNFKLIIPLSVMMFLYGFPTGSLIAETDEDYKSVIKNITYRYIWIIIIGLALYLVI